MSSEVKMHHLQVTPSQIGKYVILPGDPGRVEKIARHLENPYFVNTNREYTIWNGTLEGETVTVMSTGMGGPSTAIGVEELKMCGAEVLIRLGTCGGIDPEIKPGTLIIATGSIRKEGTTREYVPIENIQAFGSVIIKYSVGNNAIAICLKSFPRGVKPSLPLPFIFI